MLELWKLAKKKKQLLYRAERKRKRKGSCRRRAVSGTGLDSCEVEMRRSSQKSSAGDRDVGVGVGVALIGQLRQVGTDRYLDTSVPYCLTSWILLTFTYIFQVELVCSLKLRKFKRSVFVSCSLPFGQVGSRDLIIQLFY